MSMCRILRMCALSRSAAGWAAGAARAPVGAAKGLAGAAGESVRAAMAAPRKASLNRWRGFDRQGHEHQGGVIRIRHDLEAELPAHGEHGAVLAQHLALDGLEPHPARDLDHLLHQAPAEAGALQV